MHLNRLDLNLLVALDALLSECNVTRAAERLHVSQPAMSGALQRLRVYLHDQLLEPAGHHRMQLTPRGRRLARPVKELLLSIQATLSGDPDFLPAEAERYFQIGMSSYCTELLGPRFLADLRLHAPRVRCRFHDLSAQSIASVASGELDFCITLAERSLLDPAAEFQDLSAEHLFTDQFVVIGAAKNTRLSRKLTLQEYYALPSVEVRLFGDMASLADRMIRRYDEPSNSVAVVPSFYLALVMLKDSPMVTLAPAMMAQAHEDELELKWVRPSFALPELNESIIWQARNDADPAHVWFRQRIKAVASRLGVKGSEEKKRLA